MIHGMMLVRNEESRRLETEYRIFSDVLFYIRDCCDRMVVIDDLSTDNTFQLIEKYADEKYQAKWPTWEKNEVSIRKELWEVTVSKAKHNDWIICLDADELVGVNTERFKNFIELLPLHIDGIGFRLFDMWDMDHYREDNHWKAHFYPWCFAVRYDENKEYKWHDKALHCGRFPANASERMLPTEIPVKHYGWALEEDRKKKYDRYMRIDGEGKHGILAQYNSILDESPRLIRYGGDR